MKSLGEFRKSTEDCTEVQVSFSNESDTLMSKSLSKADWELITSSLIGYSVTIKSECLECKDVMPKESYKRDLEQSDRLIYLVNVLQGRKKYHS